MFPTVHHHFQIGTREHRAVLNRRPPTQRVWLSRTALLGCRQVYRSIEIGEVEHHAVFVNESAPDFGVRLLPARLAIFDKERIGAVSSCW
ncbi:MAG: hypothetical protein ACKVI3_18775, partial [Verrucomicrobiia bacterium]